MAEWFRKSLSRRIQLQAGAGGANAGGNKAADDNVVDAEFEEVKDDKK